MTVFVFCFPYRGIGGVPTLFMRIARRLASSDEHDVRVVDFPDGAMACGIAGSRVRLIPYHQDTEVAIPADSILVFQSLNPWAMWPNLQIPDSVRLFFWNCHPFNLVPILPGMRGLLMSRPRLGRFVVATMLCRYRTVLRQLIDFMIQRRGLVFMDRTNIETTEYYLRIRIPEPIYLPIPAGEIRSPVSRSQRHWSRDGLRLAWVGRIADFKYPILRHTLRALDGLVRGLDVPVVFSIVGEGQYADNLRHDIAKLKNLKVQTLGEMSEDGLQQFLSEDVDVLFAMGTSALEGARLGIPTVLLDVAYGDVPEGYVFTWIQERANFTLGELVSSRNVRPGNQSLRQLLTQVMSDYDSISRSVHAFYGNGHSLEGVARKFQVEAELSSCFYKDFSVAGFSARDPIYDTFARVRRQVQGRK